MLKLWRDLSPKKKAWCKEMGETIGWAGILALLIRSFIIQPLTQDGTSPDLIFSSLMEPTSV